MKYSLTLEANRIHPGGTIEVEPDRILCNDIRLPSSASLAPAIKLGDATLSFDKGQFVLDFADGQEHKIEDFNFPQGRIRGDTEESVLQKGFAAICSFLSACAESRHYARGRGKDAMEGENSNLFPSWVGEWAEQFSEEIGMAAYELEETPGLIEASND